MTQAASPTRLKNYRLAHAILADAKLKDQGDKHLLVEALLGVKVESFADLSDQQFADFTQALSDWRTVENARKHTGVAVAAAIETLLAISRPDGFRAALLAFCSEHGLVVTDLDPVDQQASQLESRTTTESKV